MKTSFFPKIDCCGYYDTQYAETDPMDLVELRIPICYEIEYFDRACEPFLIDGVEVPIEKDTVMITRPGCRRFDPVTFRTVYLKFHANDELAQILDRLPTAFVTLHSESVCRHLHDIIRRNDEACFTNKQDTHYTLQQTSSILMLMDLLYTDAKQYLSHTDQIYPRMHAAKEFIEAHYAEPIRISDIASSIFISESHLRSCFRETYHISPHAYLRNTRIMAAKELLWKNENTLSEIAVLCGFKNAKNFSEIFSHTIGMSPRAYRLGSFKQYRK